MPQIFCYFLLAAIWVSQAKAGGDVGKLFLPLGLLPAILFISAWYFHWQIFPGGSLLTTADVWSIAGTILGYYGVLFSGYAAYQVKELSEKYFARTRFPQIKKSFEDLTKQMANSGDKTATQLRSERFTASIPVKLGEVKRVPGHKLNALLKRAKSEHKLLIGWIKDIANADAKPEAIYWDLYRTLEEISQEIEAHIKDQVAK
jgi:hypothetical protein